MNANATTGNGTDSSWANWAASFCGSPAPFRVWDPEANDFGVCFTQLAFTIPTHALLALVSAYFAGALAG